MAQPASSAIASPGTSNRTPFRTTLSNFGQVVTGRRLMRRRRGSGDIPSRTSPTHTTPRSESQSRSSVAPSSSSHRHPASLRTSSMSSADRVRQAIRSAVASRTAFEPEFQSLTNDVLSGLSDIPPAAVGELFQQLKGPTIPFSSRCLSLEVNLFFRTHSLFVASLVIGCSCCTRRPLLGSCSIEPIWIATPGRPRCCCSCDGSISIRRLLIVLSLPEFSSSLESSACHPSRWNS